MSKLSRKYQKLADVQPPKEEKQATGMSFSPCIVCNKPIGEGYYGRFGEGGVCSKDCNTTQSLKPKYPAPHDEQSFLERICEDMDNDH